MEYDGKKRLRAMKNLQRGKNWFQGGERGVKHRSSFKVGECCPRPTKTNQEVREYILTEKINKRMRHVFQWLHLTYHSEGLPRSSLPTINQEINTSHSAISFYTTEAEVLNIHTKSVFFRQAIMPLYIGNWRAS